MAVLLPGLRSWPAARSRRRPTGAGDSARRRGRPSRRPGPGRGLASSEMRAGVLSRETGPQGMFGTSRATFGCHSCREGRASGIWGRGHVRSGTPCRMASRRSRWLKTRLSLEREGSCDTCHNSDEPSGHHAERNRPGGDGRMLCGPRLEAPGVVTGTEAGSGWRCQGPGGGEGSQCLANGDRFGFAG